MATLELEFEAGALFGTGPVMKRAFISLQTWASDERGGPRLSCECVSAEEVEAEVRRLKAALDDVAVQAKRMFGTC